MDAGVIGSSGTRPDRAVLIPTTSAHAGGWVLRSAAAADIEVIAELRATAMRPDLERLGRYDEYVRYAREGRRGTPAQRVEHEGVHALADLSDHGRDRPHRALSPSGPG